MCVSTDCVCETVCVRGRDEGERGKSVYVCVCMSVCCSVSVCERERRGKERE